MGELSAFARHCGKDRPLGWFGGSSAKMQDKCPAESASTRLLAPRVGTMHRGKSAAEGRVGPTPRFC